MATIERIEEVADQREMTEDVVEMKEIWGGETKDHLEAVTMLKKKEENLVITERVGEMRVEIMKKIAEEDILEVLEMTTGTSETDV